LGLTVVVGDALGTEDGIMLGAFVSVGGALGVVDGARLGAVVGDDVSSIPTLPVADVGLS